LNDHKVLKATNLIDVRCTYRRVKTYVFFVKTQSGDYIQFKITAATATQTECISGHKGAYHVNEDTYTFFPVFAYSVNEDTETVWKYLF
jgi:hypothetical protein